MAFLAVVNLRGRLLAIGVLVLLLDLWGHRSLAEVLRVVVGFQLASMWHIPRIELILVDHPLVLTDHVAVRYSSLVLCHLPFKHFFQVLAGHWG